VGKWAGKHVIGLTGNIGTGKSVVRRMLEHLGAYGIDADALAHRATAKGAPGYQPVVNLFGRWVVGPDGQINRQRLARIVFSDPEALVDLEKIVHPLVGQAIDLIVRRSTQPVVVIEAIKLLEAGIGKNCNSIWVTTVPPEIQKARLMKSRGMSDAEAIRRIQSQPSQEQKIAAATVVIKNTGSFENTWMQVQAAWQKLIPAAAQVEEEKPAPAQPAPVGELSVKRARPRQSAEIAALVNRLQHPNPALRGEDIMAAFGEKAFLLLMAGQAMAGLIGWQVENLVSRTTEILVEPGLPLEKALPILINEMERASRDLQSEASLVFVPSEIAKLNGLWRSLGYEPREPKALGVQAWQEAAQESMQADTILYFKQLRTDRVLRPI
jgi:dephospho-CoA kinase